MRPKTNLITLHFLTLHDYLISCSWGIFGYFPDLPPYIESESLFQLIDRPIYCLCSFCGNVTLRNNVSQGEKLLWFSISGKAYLTRFNRTISLWLWKQKSFEGIFLTLYKEVEIQKLSVLLLKKVNSQRVVWIFSRLSRVFLNWL